VDFGISPFSEGFNFPTATFRRRGTLTGPVGLPHRKKWLSARETELLLDVAKKHSGRDYRILLLCRCSFRIGEVVGCENLHGVRTMDLRKNGIWIRGKGGGEYFIDLPPELASDLLDYSTKYYPGEEQRLFPISERRAEQFVKDYAKEAGIEDWEYVSPHRLRAFYATDQKNRGRNPFTIRDGMRHKSVDTTNDYVGPPTPEEREKIASTLLSTVTPLRDSQQDHQALS